MRLTEADATTLAAVLENAMLARGYSVPKAAGLVGMSHQHFYRIMRGEANPTLGTLLGIARKWDFPELFEHLGIMT